MWKFTRDKYPFCLMPLAKKKRRIHKNGGMTFFDERKNLRTKRERERRNKRGKREKWKEKENNSRLHRLM